MEIRLFREEKPVHWWMPQQLVVWAVLTDITWSLLRGMALVTGARRQPLTWHRFVRLSEYFGLKYLILDAIRILGCDMGAMEWHPYPGLNSWVDSTLKAYLHPYWSVSRRVWVDLRVTNTLCEIADTTRTCEDIVPHTICDHYPSQLGSISIRLGRSVNCWTVCFKMTTSRKTRNEIPLILCSRHLSAFVRCFFLEDCGIKIGNAVSLRRGGCIAGNPQPGADSEDMPDDEIKHFLTIETNPMNDVRGTCMKDRYEHIFYTSESDRAQRIVNIEDLV